MKKSSRAQAPTAAALRSRHFGRYRYTKLRWHLLFSVIDLFGNLAVAFCRMLAFNREAAVAEERPRSILLVQLDHLGDAVISTVLLRGLRRRYPDASIDVLCGAWNAEFFAGCPEVNQIFASQVNRFARAGRFGWLLATLGWGMRLRSQHYDLAVDARGEFPLALLIWLSGARRRLGWNCGGGGFLLTDSPEFVVGREETASRQALLKILGGDSSLDHDPPSYMPSESARLTIRRRMQRMEMGAGKLIAMHIGAGTQAKRWPAEHWRELLRLLLKYEDSVIALVGGEHERVLARLLIASLRTESSRLGVSRVIDLTGELRIAELAALLERADLFVGGDSGPAHLAAAVGRPAVVLFSGTNDPVQWRPQGAGVRVVKQETACSPCHREICPVPGHPCMSQLCPARVYRTIVELLGDIEPPPHKPSALAAKPCVELMSV